MTTNTSEHGRETLIMRHMTGADGMAVLPHQITEHSLAYGGTGYVAGSPRDYDRAHAIDATQLWGFLHATQPDTLTRLQIADLHNPGDINRNKFLSRVSSEVGRRGFIDVLRKGIDHGPLHVTLFYGTP